MADRVCPRCGSANVDEQGWETGGPVGWQSDGTVECGDCDYVWALHEAPPPPPRPTTASDPGTPIKEGDGFLLACALIAVLVGGVAVVALLVGAPGRSNRLATVPVPLSEVIRSPRAYAGRGISFGRSRDLGACFAAWTREGELRVARVPCDAIPDDLLRDWH